MVQPARTLFERYSPRSPHRLSRSRPSLRASPSSDLCRVLLPLPAWTSGVGSRCCRGARARLAGVVSRRTPRMPSSSLVAIKIAASGPSPETGAAASTPTNKRAIPAAVAAAAAAAGVAALGVVASITMARGDLIELEEANNYGITAQNPKKSAIRIPPHPRRWCPLCAPAILVVFKCIRARRGALWVGFAADQRAAKGARRHRAGDVSRMHVVGARRRAQEGTHGSHVCMMRRAGGSITPGVGRCAKCVGQRRGGRCLFRRSVLLRLRS